MTLNPAENRVPALIEQLAASLAAAQRRPQSTYRLQFHAGFTFRDARVLVPYLHDLGITDCYASPYLKARPGSMHGYDISDHQALNPEVGNQADYDRWIEVLHEKGMGQILDVVPNHMGIVGNENAWWNDVLENGPSARHAGYFDIDWDPIKPELRDKVLLGMLGKPYGKVLESGQITLGFDAGGFAIHYFEHRFPVAPESALLCLRLRFEELEQTLGKDCADLMEYHSILTALEHLPARSQTEPLKIDERYREKEVVKRRLATLTEQCPRVLEFIQHNVGLFNGNPNDPHSFDLLEHLLNDQSYRLAFWQVAADEINYRRFFDVNELAALSMEKPEVFADTHKLILRLLRERKVTGLRIDHPDGLYDPRQYLDRLQQHYLIEQAQRLAEEGNIPLADYELADLETALRQRQAEGQEPWRRPLYLVVEKILAKDEPLAEDWATQGTTGYEFLNLLNGLFVDSSQEVRLTRIYQRATQMHASFRPYVYDKKYLILQVSLSSELHLLAQQLDRLSEKNRLSRDFTLNSLRHALRETIACFPVYRSYINQSVSARDRRYVEIAVGQAKRKNPAISSTIFDFVRDMILLEYPAGASESDRAEQRRFVGKFQQVTSPVMAKGLEDTAFYVYNRLVSLNEVGGDPGRFGVQPADLHNFFKNRQQHWPTALSTTSTHDSKRSEDVRARINVLSELAHDWQKHVARWKRINKRHRLHREAFLAPGLNDEYLLYQTLVGAWPLPTSPPDPQAYADFVQRIGQYMAKAVREAKVHSSWINPDPVYDEALQRFVARVLDEKINARFLADFRPFQARVSHFGLLNSLAQTLLKIAAPGVADFYQGNELWDFSLVDPDNRRAVDYERRQRLLDELKTRSADAARLPELARELAASMHDGRIKLYVTYRGLHCRRDHAELFSEGEYLPIAAGDTTENVFAFLRRRGERWGLAAVPRLITTLISNETDLPLGPDVWHDRVLVLPGIEPGQRCRNIFTGEVLDPFEQNGQTVLPLAQVFANFPVALLLRDEFV
jgi:(1->4)-alpha-D-glucan 1-alpha-D-glucosylmutase